MTMMAMPCKFVHGLTCEEVVQRIAELESLVRDFCKLVPRLDFPTDELDDAAYQLICRAETALGLEVDA